MWKKINVNEKCKFLRENGNSLYTVPDAMELEHNPSLRSDADITFYNKVNDVPQILIKKGWSVDGLWEETYFVWEVENESTSS